LAASLLTSLMEGSARLCLTVSALMLTCLGSGLLTGLACRKYQVPAPSSRRRGTSHSHTRIFIKQSMQGKR
jgi:hypothetical protein